jgi:Lon protease-like protein
MAEAPTSLPEIVPVFPLPEVVLFPRTILPLHVFEPRYREMMAETLLSERILAIALLKPGYTPLYHTRRAPIHATVGVGSILESEQLDDGNYNFLLRGVSRARITAEVGERSFRQARIEPIATFWEDDPDSGNDLRQELFDAIRGNTAIDGSLQHRWLQLVESDSALDTVVDLIAAGVPAEAELRQQLFEALENGTRTRLLLDQLNTLRAIARTHRRVITPEQNNPN